MKNLKVSSPKIIERVDRFGKESRFVNQIGSVPSTETEMFGCEIVRDLPDYVNNFVNGIGHDVVIKVPMSNPESLTGSGENGKCHLNSKLLSLLNHLPPQLSQTSKLTSLFLEHFFFKTVY